MAKQTGSYDFKAAKAAHDEASQKATNYIFKSTGHDAWVCDEDAGPNPSTGEAYGPNDEKPTTGWRIGSVFELVRQGVSWFKLWVDDVAKIRLGRSDQSHLILDSDSLDVEDSSSDIVAQFGASGAQIGKSGESHVELDYHSMQLIDKEGDTYFHVSDLRGSDGFAYFTDTFTGDGIRSRFTLSTWPAYRGDIPEPVVYIGSTRIYWEENPHVGSITFSIDAHTRELDFWNLVGGNADSPYVPATGAVISVTYAVSENIAKTFTFGSRNTTRVAALSSAFGNNVLAGGMASFAEGEETAALGVASNAHGWGTVAASDYQTAIGMYNEEDDAGDYALIIGNGDSIWRKNALAVDWYGIPYHRNPADTWGSVFDLIYPIGSIYMSVNDTSPATLFGGTWEQIQGRFIVAAGNNGASGDEALNISAGSTGGKSTVTLTSAQSGVPAHHHGMNNHTHTVTIGKHQHTVSYTTVTRGTGSTTTRVGPYGSASYPSNLINVSETDLGTKTSSQATGNTADNTAANASSSHENKPPYLAVYVWKRTA